MADNVAMAAPYVAEFVGTYMLVLTVGCNVLTGSPVWAVTSIACTLMAMIYALANVSGAHLNPAVSLAVGIVENDWKKTGFYILSQLSGGILAGLSYSIALGETFNLAPTSGSLWYQAGLAEFIYTFMLCFVVLNVACSKDAGNQYFGLAIGFVVIAGGYGAGHISGGCFNPAVALGIDVSSAMIGFGWSIAYIIFEFLGAAAAAGLYWCVRQHERDESEVKLPAIFLSEFIGTFMLVLTVGLNVLGGSKAPVWSIACALMCMIYALGSVSGAHFNPAVTACVMMTNRKTDFKACGVRVAAQLTGGIVAGFTYCLMEGGRTFPLAPGKGFTIWQAAFAEVIFTFLLCYVVCTVATVNENKLTQYFGLAIGSCVTAGGYAIGAVSGGSLNPAVSFGISLVHCVNGGGILNAIWYSLFEIVGGAIAAGLFIFTHSTDSSFKQDLNKDNKV